MVTTFYSSKKNRKASYTLDEVTILSDLCPANYYESQILSALKNWKGKRLTSYLLPSIDYTTLSEMRKEFNQVNDDEKQLFSPIKIKNFDVGASVECDLYFNPSCDLETDIDISSFLSGAVIDLKNLSDRSQTGSMNRAWVFVEVSQGPKFLLQKLWQLERAVHILTRLDPKFSPSNLVVLLNGDETEAKLAMANICIPENARIRQYPLFVGWTPTRNIFKMLGTLQSEVSAMKIGQDNLKIGQDNLKSGLDKLESDMKSGLDKLETDMKSGLDNLRTDISGMRELLEEVLSKLKK